MIYSRVVVLLLCSLVFTFSFSQQIALTFDDAPLGGGPLFSGEERTTRIIESLKKNHVKTAAFFVVSGFIDSTNINRIHAYSNAGHLIANHSHTHSWIQNIGTANYIHDIQTADSILKKNFPYKQWYRYPFLNEGRSVGSRDSIRAALKEMNLSNGYVTVDDYDWYLAGALRKAISEKKKVDYTALKQLYIEHIWNSIQFYDKIGKKVLGRSPKHVLLLHENDLAALFIGDLIKFLKHKGWQIISPEEAYQDPIANEVPDVLFNGQGRIGAIAYAKGMPAKELVQETEDEEYLEKLLKERKVFQP